MHTFIALLIGLGLGTVTFGLLILLTVYVVCPIIDYLIDRRDSRLLKKNKE